jgi:hypothetical protein
MVYEIKILIKLSINIPFQISDIDKNKLAKIYEYRFHSDRVTYEVFDILKEKMKMEIGLDHNMYHYILYSDPNTTRNIKINSTQKLHIELKNGIQHNGSIPLILIVENIQQFLQHFNISSIDEPEVCPVCLNSSIQFIQPYMCSHQICVSCHEECVSHSLFNCSLCRSESRQIVNNINYRIQPIFNIMR